MNISEFIIRKLDSFLDKFKNAKVIYGVDKLANVHTVEVYPASLCDRDDVFEAIDAIVTESIERYPDQLLCMGEHEPILGVGELLYEKSGDEYEG
jgi:hypothetical protein